MNLGARMTDHLLGGLIVILALLAADGAARPSGLRSVKGMAVLLGAGAALAGAAMLVTGALVTSAVIVVLVAGAFTMISNIKRQVLGEPLVFSDFALVGAVFKHPHFYASALKGWQIAAIGLGLAAIVVMTVLLSATDLMVRAAGLAIALVATAGLRVTLALPGWATLAGSPDIDRDVRNHGLIVTLLIYWHHWSRLPRLAPPALPKITFEADQLVVVVQCESFADPTDLFGTCEEPLAGLAKARSLAWRCGKLMAPGFGAYTMRTEFGALFGLGEKELGLRRFDPFLTAMPVASGSLANRLGDERWTRVFLHPHDMRFYGRDRLMPAAGFDTIIDEQAFLPQERSGGRYITDKALGDKLISLAGGTSGSMLIYAVTIENHGPWGASSGEGPEDNKSGYLRLLRNSDALLSRLVDELPKLGRPVTLCLFGDHRPSIPIVCTPGGDRHTPFVILRFEEDGTPISSPHEHLELTPAELHHEILRTVEMRGHHRTGA